MGNGKVISKSPRELALNVYLNFDLKFARIFPIAALLTHIAHV